MTKLSSDDKAKLKKTEPNIIDLEKTVQAFRDAHGEKDLMRFISEIIKNISKTSKITKKSDKKDEPKISELEAIFKSFQNIHGKSKLMESVDSATKKTHTKEGNTEKINPKKSEQTTYNAKKGSPKNTGEKTNTVISTKNHIIRIYSFIQQALKLKRYRYPVIAASVFFGIYFLFNLPTIYTRLSWSEPETPKNIVRTEETVQRKMADSATLDPGEVIPTENRIVIPKIKVSAPVIFPSSYDEKVIESELHNGVVHYNGTANPGEVGNSFITGHSSNYWWDTGKFNYVFVLLDKLEAGDKVITYYNGKKFVYTVRDKVVTEPSDMSVLAPTETPVLTLMTCTPPGTSWKRLIVHLDRTDPAYYKPEKVIKEKVVELPKKEEKSFFSKIVSFFIPN